MNLKRERERERESRSRESYIPFIQFFSGWKWKAVLCHLSMEFVHGYVSFGLRNIITDFADTPSATPLGKTLVTGLEEASSTTSTLRCWCSDSLRPRAMSSRRTAADKERTMEKRKGLIDLHRLGETSLSSGRGE